MLCVIILCIGGFSKMMGVTASKVNIMYGGERYLMLLWYVFYVLAVAQEVLQ